MAGRAPYTEDESAVIEGCYLLDDKGPWEPASNSLNRYSSIRKELKSQKMNPNYMFSKKMFESNESISLGLVVNARGAFHSVN